MTIQSALEYLEGARFANYSGQIIAEHQEKQKDYIVCELSCTCGEIPSGSADEYGEVLVTVLNAATALPDLLAALKEIADLAGDIRLMDGSYLSNRVSTTLAGIKGE